MINIVPNIDQLEIITVNKWFRKAS